MSNSFHMAYAYPREVEKARAEKWPVLLPVGTVEYHSSHCPYGCDALTAIGVAEKVAEEIDCMILPPVWYGISSYAVGGPETCTVNMDQDVFEGYIYNILKSLFKSGFTRNICILIYHQTEEFLPTALSCMRAAKKLTFEYLEETKGTGWWGNKENAGFYNGLSAEDNPWNWIRVFGPRKSKPHLPGDHAGIHECSMMEYLYPGSIKLDRIDEKGDWFAQSAREMSPEHGADMVRAKVDDIISSLRNGTPCY